MSGFHSMRRGLLYQFLSNLRATVSDDIRRNSQSKYTSGESAIQPGILKLDAPINRRKRAVSTLANIIGMASLTSISISSGQELMRTTLPFPNKFMERD